jgi:hypothetical protein
LTGFASLSKYGAIFSALQARIKEAVDLLVGSREAFFLDADVFF